MSDQLMKAIKRCDLRAIDIFFDNGGNINEVFCHGTSPLIFAIKNSFCKYAVVKVHLLNFYDEVILRLLKEGANTHVRDSREMTPLMLALECTRSDEVVQQLLDCGSNVNARCNYGKTPLIYAIENYNTTNIITNLFHKDKNINRKNKFSIVEVENDLDFLEEERLNKFKNGLGSAEKRSVLYRNIKSHNADRIITLLINNGADINCYTYFRETPLMYALDNNIDPSIIIMLINSVSNINAQSAYCEHALIYAVCSKVDKRVVVELIKKGCDINIRCSEGRTSLSYAGEFYEDPEICSLLINSGADPNTVCDHGMSPLMYAVGNCNKMVVLEFIKNCSNVNQVCGAHNSALFYAVSKENIDLDVITALISAGADIFHHNVKGRNLLMKIKCKKCSGYVDCKNKKIIDFLLKSGIDLNETDGNGSTILHLTNCMYLMSLAIKQGISIDQKNNDGNTPLMVSIIHNDFEKVNALLLQNANPNSVNSKSLTPLHNFGCKYDDVLLELLLYHGADLFQTNLGAELTPLEYLIHELSPDQKKIISVLVKYLLLFYDESHFSDDIQQFLYQSDYFKKFVHKCKDEIEKMRYVLIKENLSFYEFCNLKKSFRSKFVRISLNNYNYNFYQIKELFPLYHNFIVKRVKDNHKYQLYRVLRNSLEKIVIRPISVCNDNLTVELGFDSWYLICHYLNYKDLYNIFLASL